MRMAILWLVLGGIAGAAAGFAGGLFAYPYVFRADLVADEPLSRDQRGTVVAGGSFVHVDPDDPVHYGRGRVTVYPDVVRLEADFEVGPGPDYRVYLVGFGNVRRSSDVEGGRVLDLGPLRAFKGAQNYWLPPEIELRRYRSVVIWCETFDVLVSPATLTFAD